MTGRPADHDFSHLPPTVPVEETVAQQLERDQPYGGPGGGGDTLDADGD